MKPASKQALRLFHEGALALAKVEEAGIKVDTKYLNKAIRRVYKSIDKLETVIKKDKVYKIWENKYGRKLNLESGPQLADILYYTLKYPITNWTDSEPKKPKTDEKALQNIGIPFTDTLIKITKLRTLVDTFLKGIKKTLCKGKLHCIYNLNLARSYRSSCESINFQNLPVRNKETSEIARSCFIPSHPDHQIVEVDFSGIEVRIAACYHKDPTMLKYLKGHGDMHKDMAAQIYMLDLEEVHKDARYAAKNMFVFPQFYGDYYINCARALWDAIIKLNLKTNSGVSLKDHLAKKGIKKLGKCDPKQKPRPGTFEYHLWKIEKHFWEKRFPVYNQWKKKWWGEYLKKGYFHSFTGFKWEGILNRNEVINYPVQGAAFHCLLWCLTRIQEEMERRGMKSKIVGQIHDSIVGDIHKDELKLYLKICKRVMTKDILEHYKWINVPIEVEAEVAPLGKSWFHKQKVEIAA